MLQKLKQCKTLTELYQALGEEPFEKAAAILLYVWCILPLFSIFSHFYWGFTNLETQVKVYNTLEDYKICMQIVGSLSMLLAILYGLGKLLRGKIQWKSWLKQEPWQLFLLLLLLWSGICTLMSRDTTTAFQGTDYRFDGFLSYLYYAGAYVCAMMVVRKETRKRIMQVFTLAASVISAIVILQDQEVSVFAKCFLKPRAAVFYHFNHTGYYLNLSIVCLMGLYLYGSSRKERIYYSLSLAFQIYAILVNSTLGSYLGSLGALIFMVIFYLVRKEQGKWRVLVPVLIFILVSWASYMGWVPTSSGEDMRVNIETLTKDTSDIVSNPLEATDAGHGRMTLWQEGLKMVAKSPIFGYGPDSIDPDLTTEEIKTKFWTERADNEFIQCAISNGIPGLLLYLLTLFSMAIYRLRDLKKLSAETVIAAGCVIAYLISGCFGNTMFYTTPYLFLFLGMVAHEKNK